MTGAFAVAPFVGELVDPSGVIMAAGMFLVAAGVIALAATVRLLATKPGHVFTRRQIMEHLWESEHVGDEHADEVHISNLRRKVERDPGRPRRIVTVRSAGYKLVVA
jgi:hypothetical protein